MINSVCLQKLRGVFTLLLILLLSGCGFSEKNSIVSLLDARDVAVSSRDIQAFAALLAEDYLENGLNKADRVRQETLLFQQFEQIEMRSHDRNIYLDGPHAECEQSYTLRVFRDNTWRSMVQRERIRFKKTASGWKVIAGI